MTPCLVVMCTTYSARCDWLFDVGRASTDKFSFCGLEISQYDDSHAPFVAKKNIVNTRLMSYPNDALSTSEATSGDIEQMMPVVGSPTWTARQVRADLCCRVARAPTNIRHVRCYRLKETSVVAD